MSQERLKKIAEQVFSGKKLHEIEFGTPAPDLDEKLSLIDRAIKLYPVTEAQVLEEKGAER